jgi:hypothetical protein
MRTTNRLDATIRALVLVRLGQELGSESSLARAVYDLGNLLLAFLR